MPKITIFGLAGAGTSTVGKALAERLGYKFVSSGEIFRKKAADMGLELHKFHTLAEKNDKFDKELDKEIEKFGKENDDFVVESRLAWFFIPDSIKIKLFCEFNECVRRVAERDEISVEEARERVTSRENTDSLRYKNFYGINDINDDKHFDLIIDTSAIAPQEIVNRITAYIGLQDDA